MDPWKPEFEVTPDLATALLTAQFPELAPIKVTRLDSGWDNVIYEVNERWYFRFPQRKLAVEGVEREIASLPKVAELLTTVPKIEFFGTPSELYPWSYFGYLPLAGRESCELELGHESRTKLARPLAELLKRLHSPVFAESQRLELPEDPLGRMDFNKRVPMTEARLSKLQALGVSLPYESLLMVLRRSLETPRLAPRAVVHGDLHFRHIVVAPGGGLSGLIDWGDIHLNDPATDLQIYWSFFSAEGRREFREAYGEISELQLIQARSFAVFVNVALLEYAVSEGRKAVEREACFALQNLLTSGIGSFHNP